MFGKYSSIITYKYFLKLFYKLLTAVPISNGPPRFSVLLADPRALRLAPDRCSGNSFDPFIHVAEPNLQIYML